MRLLRLAALASISAVAACHDTIPQPAGPDTPLALHFDTLAGQASAGSQASRSAALDLVLRTLADGADPTMVNLSTGTAGDTSSFSTVTWSVATAKVNAEGQDSVTDSLMVFVAWRGLNPDTIVVGRLGDPTLAPQEQAELETLGIATSVPADTGGGAGALVIGNAVSLANSSTITGGYEVLGGLCQYITVTSIANDEGTACSKEIFSWSFDLRFSSSNVWGLVAGVSQGVVILK
jgi:hypothetical protein